MNSITTGRSFLSVLAFVMLLVPVAFAADGGDVVIRNIQGDVRVTVRGAERAARKDSVLELPAHVRTGNSSSVELRQGKTSVEAAANTHLEIPAPAVRGTPVERVIQSKGNAFYDVAKRDAKKLRVETPYLVAVVKGTQFNVVVQDDSTTISLFEGRLEIHSSDDTDVVTLEPGQIATRRGGDQRIRVLRMDTGQPVARAGDGIDSGATIEADASIANDGVQPDALVASDRNGAGELSDGGLDGGATTTAAVGTPGAASTSGMASVEVGGASGVDTRVGIQSAGAELGAGGASVAANVGGVDVGASVGVNASGVSAGADLGASIGGTSVTAGVGAGLGAGGASIDAGVGASLGSAASVDLGAGVDIGSGGASVAANVGANIGSTASVDLGASASIGSGGVSAGADLGASVGSTSVTAGVGAGLGAGGASIDAGVGANLGSTAGVDLGASANIGGGTTSVAVNTGVDLGNTTTSIGASTTADLGTGTTNLATTVSTPVTDVSAGVSVSPTSGVSTSVSVGPISADIGVNLGTGTIDLGLGGSSTSTSTSTTPTTTGTGTSTGGATGDGSVLGGLLGAIKGQRRRP